MRVSVTAHELDHALLDLRAGAQCRDQFGVSGELRHVAASLVQGGHVAVDVGVNRLRVEVTHAGQSAAVTGPQRLQVGEALLAVLRGHVAAHEGLGGALEFTRPYQVYVDVELADRILVVHAVSVIAGEQDEAHRVEVQLVGLGGEVILAVEEITAARDHLLAAAAKFADGRGQLLEFRQPGAGQIVGLEEQRLHAPVGGGLADRVGEVGQQRLRGGLALRLAERALERLAGELLDDLAGRPQYQRAALRQPRDRAAQRRHQQRQQAEQQQQVQHPAQYVQAAPGAAQEVQQVTHAWRLSPARTATARTSGPPVGRPLPRPSLRCAPTCRRDRAGSKASRDARCRDA